MLIYIYIYMCLCLCVCVGVRACVRGWGGGRDIVAVVATRPRSGESGVRSPASVRDFSHLENFWTGSGAHPA
jgi:hypothetical protein